MAQITISGLTQAQEEESDDAFVEVLGPIPVDEKGDPIYTKREFRDECIFGYFKIILSQFRGVEQKKIEVPHSTNVENEYGKIDK